MAREGEIQVKEFSDMRVAFLSRTGSYDQIPEAMGSLMSWIFNRGIQPSGPPMGIYYNSPESVSPDELRWDVAIPVPEDIEGEDEIAVRVLPGGKVATALHKGPYEQVGLVYGEIFDFIAQEGLRPAGPPMEVYLNDPGQVAPEEISTEVWVPVTIAPA